MFLACFSWNVLFPVSGLIGMLWSGVTVSSSPSSNVMVIILSVGSCLERAVTGSSVRCPSLVMLGTLSSWISGWFLMCWTIEPSV